jgi:hypothetical protein
MKIQESKGKLNCKESGELLVFPDTEVEWYDFGGGFIVAPGIPGTDNADGNIVALCCIRSGRYYYKMFEGTFTKEDLPRMFKEYAPAFEADVKLKTQETQK